ncbi:MAG: T9SS type A sorting domain-containing protein [Candidatus Cyclobacteriaceae bacterium M2_1C_046]
MRRIFTLTCLAFIVSVNAFAEKDCGESCFSSDIVSVVPTEGGCYEYTLQVSWAGECTAALSHYTVEVPCGEVTALSNSENWAQEINVTDPTTGLTGFKIDDIQDFGEEGSPESFTVTFTICPDDNCETDLSCWSPKVAYKAATCAYYETIEYSCSNLDATLSITNATCSDSNDGILEVNILDGTAPFTYSWSNGDTSRIISGLSGGTYAVVVQDAHGDTLNLSAAIVAPEPLSLTYDITHTSCSGNADGSITVSANGGTAPYSYEWSEGTTDASLSNIAPGDYSLTVTDSVGCTYSQAFTVESSNSIAVTATVIKASCSTADGAIDVTVTGGSGNYTYAWLDGATSEDRTDLTPDFYTLTVSDDQGCESTRTFSVKEDNPLSVSGTITPTGCPDDSTGMITVSVSGNTGNVSYLWSTGETTATIDGLSKGRYEVTVTDESNCSKTKGFYLYGETIEVVSDIQQPTCYGDANGAINLTVADDVTISWSNGESGSSITNLSEGLYTASLTNSAGCEATYSYYIDAPDSLSFTYTVTNSTCDSSAYSVSVAVSGGTAPYTITWEDGTEGTTKENLTEGSYTINITDAQGCTTSGTVTVKASVAGCDTTDDTTDNTDDGTTDDGTTDDGTTDDGTTDDGTTDDGTTDDGTGDDTTDDGSNDDGTGDDSGDDGSNDDGSGDGTGDGDNPDDDGNLDDPINDESCSDPFDIAIVKVEDGDCSYYEATVTYNGDKSYGLSHATLSASCGDLTAVYTDLGIFETGTDPTTGVEGIKVDEIQGFGETIGEETFSFSFELCSSDCEIGSELEFVVGYKYGQCVSYDTVSFTIEGTTTTTAVYPNPTSESVSFSLSDIMSSSKEVKVELYNPFGTMVKEMIYKTSDEISLDIIGLPADIYTYRIINDRAVETGKIMVVSAN